MAKTDTDEELALLEETEFEYADPKGSKRLYSDCCRTVDQEGTAAEARFRAVLELGERIQMRRMISKKSLANVYRYAMDQVLSAYGIPKGDEEPLKKMFLSYWKHATELRVALGDIPEPARPKDTVIGRDWVKALNPQDGGDDCPEVEPTYREADIVPYSLSREAGVS